MVCLSIAFISCSKENSTTQTIDNEQLSYDNFASVVMQPSHDKDLVRWVSFKANPSQKTIEVLSNQENEGDMAIGLAPLFYKPSDTKYTVLGMRYEEDYEAKFATKAAAVENIVNNFGAQGATLHVVYIPDTKTFFVSDTTEYLVVL
ncbi:hypothetical protein RCZ04_07070 [Capnocytophaga sp. HP1101]